MLPLPERLALSGIAPWMDFAGEARGYFDADYAGPAPCSTLKRIVSSSIESRCAVTRMRSSEASSVSGVPR